MKGLRLRWDFQRISSVPIRPIPLTFVWLPEDRGKGILRDRDYTDVDGMITNVPGIVLATFYADCVPIYLADPVSRSIGLLHSGWKGTVHNIIKNGIRAMKKTYGAKPANILAGIGPSICGSCYEIGEDVAAKFRSLPGESVQTNAF